jgi:hypothetical protein
VYTKENQIRNFKNLNQMKNINNLAVEKLVQGLPEPFKKVVDLMETTEEKKMAMYAVSTIAGALMPHVIVNYDNKTNHPALMLLISYPPASGKGKLALLLLLVEKITEEQRTLNNSVLKQHAFKMKEYERAVKKGQHAELPEKPRTPLLLIPANTTSAKLTEQLAENDSLVTALLFETETDAITNMMKNKFGIDNSMMFRKIYHHEMISQMRKTNNEHLVVNNPKMAIILTGTPSQIPSLFMSNKDGLLSRFTIVTGEAPLEWKNVQPCDTCTPLDDNFKQLANEYYQMYHFFKDHSAEVKFTNNQWDELNTLGKIWIFESNNDGGENAVSIAKRHVNMLSRLAAILTMARAFEKKDTSHIIYCADSDFIIARELIEHSFECSLELFKELPGEQIAGLENLIEIFDQLPSDFTIKELTPLLKELDISKRTLERMLFRFLKLKWITKVKRGYYKKEDLTQMSELSEEQI